MQYVFLNIQPAAVTPKSIKDGVGGVKQWTRYYLVRFLTAGEEVWENRLNISIKLRLFVSLRTLWRA